MRQNQYKLSRRAKYSWLAGIVILPILMVATMFSVTDDSISPYENSEVAQKFTEFNEDSESEDPEFSNRFGAKGESRTLILYDTNSETSKEAEKYAIATANLATHFGEVEIQPVDQYRSGDMAEFDATIYLGVEHGTDSNKHLVRDIRDEESRFMWVGENVEQLAQDLEKEKQSFNDQYGWDPGNLIELDTDIAGILSYKDQKLSRVTTEGKALTIPEITNDQKVDVLASVECSSQQKEPTSCQNSQTSKNTNSGQGNFSFPWAIESGNLIYVVEVPLEYIDDNDAYLIFSDLLYGLTESEKEEIAQAAVRIEDVNPESDPEQLRAIADLLHEQRVPFQVAVIPVMLDQEKERQSWYGLTLLDVPEVVDALKYMQRRGGRLVQHGTTHQYGNKNNPYSGRTGDDYEFFGYGCSSMEFEPYEWETCEDDSWVRKKEVLPQDNVETHRERLEYGSDIIVEAGLGEPEIFVTPHYSASANAYVAMASKYEARYERTEYYSGMISDRELDLQNGYGQYFPYTVHDIYGSKVFPENLQNITEEEQNNHSVRDVFSLLEKAEKNKVVRESTASFYFHPFLSLDYLEEIIDGLQRLEYDFVPVTELK